MTGSVTLSRRDARRLIVLLDELNQNLENSIEGMCAHSQDVAYDPEDAAQLKRDRHYRRASEDILIAVSRQVG